MPAAPDPPDLPLSTPVASRALLLLALAGLGSCVCLHRPRSVRESRASPSRDFAVEPFLVLGDGGQRHLVWEPREPGDDPHALLMRGGRWSGEVPAVVDRGVCRAPLPARCGGADRLAFQVQGMQRPVPLRPLPCPSASRLRFGFITDSQLKVAPLRQVLRWLPARGLDLLLHGGDVVQTGGCVEQWRRYLAASFPRTGALPLLAAVGNHDRRIDPTYRAFRRYLGGGRRSPAMHLAAGPVDIIVLNSRDINNPPYDRWQRRWLEALLERLGRRADAGRRWRVVLMHHAPFSSSVANAGWVLYNRAPALVRDYLPLFERHRVQLVLSGHTHLYERSWRRGVNYVVGGAAGGIVAPEGAKNPHRRFLARGVPTLSLFEATAGRLWMRTLDAEGRVIDRLDLKRRGAR